MIFAIIFLTYFGIGVLMANIFNYCEPMVEFDKPEENDIPTALFASIVFPLLWLPLIIAGLIEDAADLIMLKTFWVNFRHFLGRLLKILSCFLLWPSCIALFITRRIKRMRQPKTNITIQQ